MRAAHGLKGLVLLALVGLVVFDLASAGRQQVEDPAPDAYFYETGNDEVDAVTTASITAHVAIIRSDNALLSDPVPPTERLTTAQIQDIVYAALRTDLDWQTGRPRLVEKIARIMAEQGTCWVAVKSNMVGYPGRSYYTQGDQTDIRVTKAVMTFLADETEATRISMLACGGYNRDKARHDIFEKSLFVSSGARWNKCFWDLPDDFALQNVLDELAARHPEKVIEGINLNYDEIMEDGRPYRELSASERITIRKRMMVPAPVHNGIGGLATSNFLKDGGYVPTAAILYSDLVVNVPVMKTTGKVGVNCIMKNYIGSVSRAVYSTDRGGSLQKLDHGPLVKTVVNLFSYHPSDYVVIDALVGLEGDGSRPMGNGLTGFVRRNFVMAGEDPIAMESVAGASMGLNPYDLDMLRWGRAKRWGYFELPKIAIHGNTLDEVKLDMMHPVNYTSYTSGFYYGRGNRRWLIHGAHEGSDIDVDHLGDEAEVDPVAGEEQGGVNWKPHYAPESYVDMWSMYQGDVANSTVYAFTRAYSETEQEGEVWVGATKGIEVYVNGEKLISERSTGGHAWKGIVQPVTLRAGDNRVLVKVTHVVGSNFGFSLALVDHGRNTPRTTYIPHTKERYTLGDLTSFTEEMKPKYFGGETLPGVYYHLAKSPTTAVAEGTVSSVPKQIALGQNFPNPFNERTSLPFDLSSVGKVRLILYNALGERVRTLVDETHAAGAHLVAWDGRDDRGRPVASGVYVAELQAGSFVQARRIVLLR
jgi:hypothetical protein